MAFLVDWKECVHTLAEWHIPETSVSSRQFIIGTGQLFFCFIDLPVVSTVLENKSLISLKVFLLFFLFWRRCILLYVHACVACVYVCTPHSCLVAEEIRKGHWVPYNWSHVWVLGIKPLFLCLYFAFICKRQLSWTRLLVGSFSDTLTMSSHRIVRVAAIILRSKIEGSVGLLSM